jgi:hypothetical protein
MIMKKLIVVAVVFALAAGGVFAADIGATVFGGVRLMQADNIEGTNVGYDAGMTRLRLEGSGELDDGKFGAWIRFDPLGGTATGVGANGSFTFKDEDGEDVTIDVGGNTDSFVAGLAWWKPIDQFKLTIGGNPDGLYGKEGYSGWMFYQMPSDIGIVSPHSVWGGPYLTPNWNGFAKYRNAFYGGFDGYGLFLDIKPVDMLGINLILPYFDWFGGSDPEKNGKSVGGVFKNMTVQVDVNLDFGNIALTFDLESWTKDNDKPNGAIGGKAYLYFNLSAIDNLSLDVGIGFPLPKSRDGGYKHQDPIAAGLAAKFDVNDSFGLKARLLAQFAGSETKYDGADPVKDPFVLGLDLLPYFAISDSLKAFVGLGLTMASHEDYEKAEIGWHFNPYLQIGQEWGPTFYAGIRAYSLYFDKTGEKNDKSVIHFEIPIGIQVSF